MKIFLGLVPFALMLGACSLMESMGLATPAGDPTPAGESLNELVKGMTGLDVVKLVGVVKGATVLGTDRGRQNLKDAFDPNSGLKGTMQALSAIFLGTHTSKTAASQKPAGD